MVWGTMVGAGLGMLAMAAFVRRPVSWVPEAKADATPPSPTVTCVRERRMHVFGTYNAAHGTGGVWAEPVDLTVTECLEWGAK